MSQPTENAPRRLAYRLVSAGRALRGMLGAPNYPAYLAHHQATHPDLPPMTEPEFFRYAIDRRYGKAGGMRCC